MSPLLKNRSMCYIFILTIVLVILRMEAVFCNDKMFAEPDLSFATRIHSALELASQELDGKKFWLVYSIRTTKAKLKNFPASDLSPSSNQSLYQWLLDDEQKKNNKDAPLSKDRQIKLFNLADKSDLSLSAIKNLTTDIDPAIDLAFILDYSLESGRPILYQVFVQDVVKSFDHESRPIIWLGPAATDESFAWLKYQFYASSQKKFRQQLMRALGWHDCEREVMAVSAKILSGRFSQSLKAEALALAGRSNTMFGLKVLIATAFQNNHSLLRKKALLALSQQSHDKAHLAIASIAKKEKNREIRKEAIFWLAQIASSKSIQTLHEIMQYNTDPEIREYTLFAISQLPVNQSKPMLAAIAITDPIYRIRKKARLILRHADEDKLMNFLDELVRDNDVPPIEPQNHTQ